MQDLKTILVPTDFSGCADAAVNVALDMAKRHGAAVHLLHVAEGSSRLDTPYGSHPVLAAWAKEASLLDESPLELAWGRVPIVARTVWSQDVTKTILSTITEEGVDLMVMGTHGHESVRRFLNDTPDVWGIGKTAQAVMAEVRCPVISVGPRASRSGAIECITAPVDLKSHSTLIAAHAGRMAELYGSSLQLLHVVPPDSSADYRAEQLRALRALGSLVDLPERATYRIVSGQPAEAIGKALKGQTRCMLVMGSHGQRNRGEKQIGSAADALVRAAPCMVMTVRPFGSSLVPSTPSMGHLPSWPGNLSLIQ